ncbi:methionyl-tRNA formyltransferase [Leptospira ryugenii]|uniref:Methionyl-tRNA formyltransferase n=1 Tax=Leptospira ryugenii TaxID=1917863 RepID=A0A2P2DWP0_9LEPT|nr:methionyl-tRNA formyltransferase [Leptospira ryugenii]GBF49054.1 methionyl-tRNA formyltransferase [Leptospira ryugenii]
MISIGYFGTPEFSADLLRALINANLKIDFVVTNPDKPVGRKKELKPTAVKALAESHSIPVIQSEKLRSDENAIQKIRSFPSTLHIVYAYGSIIPEAVFACPKFGSINLHGSLLPKYRGASPVQSALLHGDEITGYTIQYVSPALDSGDIIAQESWPILLSDTTESQIQTLTSRGGERLIQLLRDLPNKPFPRQAQDHSQASHCKKITSLDRPIDWTNPSLRIHNQIRALYPDPLAFTSFRGKQIILLSSWIPTEEVEIPSGLQVGSFFLGAKKRLFCLCGDGKLIGIERIQPEGKKPMAGFEFLNGARLEPGDRFL